MFSLETLYTPYALQGGWRQSRSPSAGSRSTRARSRPGFLDGVERWRAMTPDVYEREFYLPAGLRHELRRRAARRAAGPGRELTRYETPVQGLYLTGAATFPGAGVWGASGRNAARVILAR